MKKEPILFIIFGATGDLAKRKIFPAIYSLIKNKKITDYIIIAVSRRSFEIKQLLEPSKAFVQYDEEVWNSFEKSMCYVQADFAEEKDFFKLKEEIEKIEQKSSLQWNKIFYLATLPQYFDIITEQLKNSEITLEDKQHWCRVVYEKPFGENLRTAKKINNCITRIFKENQIYRIDHYLGKELVSNIALVRFTNRILEPLWNNQHIESVQIILNEEIGLEGRAEFYDNYGALKDVVQNHMMQILALVTMEAPKKLTGNYIRDEKVKILQKVKVKDIFLGQYDGYKQEKGIKIDSQTETFAVLQLEINNARWKGVSFFLKTGKFLNKKETSIHLKFKNVDCLLTTTCPSDSNYLTIRIEPNKDILFEMNAKVPGKEDIVAPVTMEFCHSNVYGVDTPEAYENLLEQVIQGNQAVFVRNDEIEAAWKIIDTIENSVKFSNKKIITKKKVLFSYKKGTVGPEELKQWCEKKKLRWRA